MNMRHLGRFSIALLGSLAALVVSFYLGFLLLLRFDSNYHDGFSAVGGFVIGLIVACLIFTVIWKKLSIWVHIASD